MNYVIILFIAHNFGDKIIFFHFILKSPTKKLKIHRKGEPVS